MSFKSDLYDYITADAGVSALISDRLYAGYAPESTATEPYIVSSRISSEGTNHMEAASKVAVDTWQFDIWASTDESREAVSEALREALDGFSGTMGTATEIRRILIKNQLDTIVTPTDGTQFPKYRTVQDYDFIYNRSVPTFP